jgi:uncharacterized protein (TIGR02145 family)
MKRLTLIILILVIIPLLPEGCKKTTQEEIPPSTIIPTQTVSGTLTLPESSTIELNQIKVYSPTSSTNISCNGTFQLASIENDKPQIILATNNNNKPILLGYVLSGLKNSAQINVTTTAKALVMLNPAFIYTNNEQRLAILNSLDNNTDFKKLVQDITTLVQLNADDVLDHSVHPTIYREAAEIAKEFLQGSKSDIFKNESLIQTQENPWVEDASGPNIIFKNPKTIYYSAEIKYSENLTRKGLLALDAKSSLVSIQFTWPPKIFTQPTETKYSLGDGSFNVTITKGVDFSVVPITKLFDLNTANGQATFYNTAKAFLLTMDLIIGYYPTIPVTSLHLDLAQSSYYIEQMAFDFADNDYISIFKDFLDLMLANTNQICYWIWQDASKEAGRIFASKLLEIMGGIDAILAGIDFVNKDLPFLYDMVEADRCVTLQLMQVNGILTTNSTNHSPIINITEPSNGSSFTAPATINITANASDPDGTISKVEFYNGSTKIGEKTSEPYSFIWNNVVAGTYSLTTVATDNLDSKTTSSPISISVTGEQPVFMSAVIENASPSMLEMTYSLSLSDIIPSASAFTIWVNSMIRTVSSVAILGTKVLLTLASQVVQGDVVTVSYTKPSTNSLQTTSGGQVATFGDQPVTNNITSSGTGIIFNPNLTYGSVTDIDGNNYKTIQIGTQTWMAENLKTTKFNDGTAISNITVGTAWAALITSSFCWYLNNAATYKDNYGALYNWYVVDIASNEGKNVCPSGWIVPTDADWTTLTDYLTNNSYGYEGSGNDIAKSMAATSSWLTSAIAGTVGNDQGKNNSSGFTAFPSSGRNGGGEFLLIPTYCIWWSSTDYSTPNSFIRDMTYNKSGINRGDYDKRAGFSIRCVKY